MKVFVLFFHLMFAATSAMAIQPGQCSAILASKTYSPSSEKNSINYQCTYECMNSEGSIEKVLAKHTFDRRTQNEMFDLVCEGVRIGKVVNNGMSIHAPVAVDPFWALLSPSQDLKSWAQRTESFPTENFIQDHIRKLRSTIELIKSSYSQIDALQFPDFREASVLLSDELFCWQSTGLIMNCPLFQTAAKLTPAEINKEVGARALALQQMQAHGKILIQLSTAGMKF